MKAKRSKRGNAIRTAVRRARHAMLRSGASETDWDQAVALVRDDWPGDHEAFGARPEAIAHARAAWCAWFHNRSDRAAQHSILAADAIGGDPVLLHLFATMESEEVGAVTGRMRALGVEPIDIVNEARRSLRACSAWTLVRVVDAVKGVAEEQHTALIRDAIAIPLVSAAELEGSGAEHALTARVARFARDLLGVIDVPALDQRQLVGNGGNARLPAAAQYIDDQLAGADIMSMDATLGALLRGVGSLGAERAASLEEKSRERMAAAREVLAGQLSDAGRALGFTSLPPSMPRRDVRALGFDRVPWDQLGPIYGAWVTSDVASYPLGMPWLNVAAGVLWEHEVRPEFERKALAVRELAELRDRKPPSTLRATMAERIIPAALSRQMCLDGFDDGTLRTRDGEELGRIAVTSDLTGDMVRAKLAAFGTVTGQLNYRELVHRSHDLMLTGADDPRAVEFVGGWEGQCEAIGVAPTTRNSAILQDMATAGSVVQWSTPHVDAGGLWTYKHRRGSRRSPGYVRYVLGDSMYPGRAAELAQESRLGARSRSRGARKALRLVPELRHSPPTDAVRRNDKGAAWILHRLVVVEMVDGAREMHEHGGIVLSADRRHELSSMVGLARTASERLWASWQSGDDNAPPLVKRVGDRWTLADDHAPERAFIESGGALRVAKAEAGRAGQAKRQRRRQRNT